METWKAFGDSNPALLALVERQHPPRSFEGADAASLQASPVGAGGASALLRRSVRLSVSADDASGVSGFGVSQERYLDAGEMRHP